MILGLAVMKLERYVGNSLDCEKGARCGTGGGGEVRRGLIRDIIEYACVGVPKESVCEGSRGSAF